ncbi:uncharacterized protein LOC129218425 [Uloborus diversus]|uniref:uncharacterized protein LOC129218425 n=1 Tax=Uloborus diversus TaxID=327109 RepID=UPI00240A093D|nr:uncharacterized protein LOC129218425 [Uloborus diversus]
MTAIEWREYSNPVKIEAFSSLLIKRVGAIGEGIKTGNMTPGICSGVEEITTEDMKSSYIAITLEPIENELEDFDHVDELIMYLVSFLRIIRWKICNFRREDKCLH